MELDSALKSFSQEQLMDEVVKLRMAIREQRDASDQEFCWFYPKLRQLLPETSSSLPDELPDWTELASRCAVYRKLLEEIRSLE